MLHRESEQADSPSPAMMLGLATAYQASQALSVAVKLGIPDLLAGRARRSNDLAQETGTQPDKMHRLLRALAAFEVVRDLGDGEFELTPSGDFLRSDAPNSVRPLVLMYGGDIFSRTAASLGECVRTGKNAFQLLHGMEDIFDYLEKHQELAHVFDGAMSGRSGLTGRGGQGLRFSKH